MKNSVVSSLIRHSVHKARYIPIFMIGVYQNLISPLLPASCRFYPTCSAYARQAVGKYGLIRGGVLALIRISKCHPFHPGGYDPLA